MTDSLDEWLDGERAAYVTWLRSTRERVAEPKAKKRGNPERDIQKAIVAFVERCAPDVFIAASVNEAPADSSDPDKRARFYASRRKAGVRPGWPDLTCLWTGGALLLEVKAPGGRLSDAQRELHPRLAAMGWPVAVVRSVEDAEAALRAAGAPVRGRTKLHMAVPAERIR